MAACRIRIWAGRLDALAGRKRHCVASHPHAQLALVLKCLLICMKGVLAGSGRSRTVVQRVALWPPAGVHPRQCCSGHGSLQARPVLKATIGCQVQAPQEVEVINDQVYQTRAKVRRGPGHGGRACGMTVPHLPGRDVGAFHAHGCCCWRILTHGRQEGPRQL